MALLLQDATIAFLFSAMALLLQDATIAFLFSAIAENKNAIVASCWTYFTIMTFTVGINNLRVNNISYDNSP